MIKKAIVKSYSYATHTATIQIIGSLSVWLTSIPVSRSIPPSEMQAARTCAVLFLDESNPDDAIIIAVIDTGPGSDSGAGAWDHIETIQLSLPSPNIDFTSISTDYNAFRLIIFIQRTYPALLSSAMLFNGDSGSNYDVREILAQGETVTTSTFMGNGYAVVGTSDNTHFSPSVCWIQNLEAGTEKDYISIAGIGATQFRHLSGRWNNTSTKITRITFEALIDNFAAGSWVTLEGCKKN